jgi:predicted transposase YbfD/YdcC
MDAQPKISFLAQFEALRDPRQTAKVLYPLREILLLVFCATVGGMEDFVEIAMWGDDHLGFLRRFLPFERGIPSHDTLTEVIAAVDPEQFKLCFAAWVEALRAKDPDIIALDGKTSRRSHDRRKGRSPLHTVSAWATRQRLVLGQEAVQEKSNEITAMPTLLQRLELTGALVTIDAIGTQAGIAELIVERGGDYLLALKRNRPATYDDVDAFFSDPPKDARLETHETVDADHGRVETRVHRVCHSFDWLFSDRRYPHEPSFPRLAMLGCIESRTERNGKTEAEKRYYLCSARLDAATFARAARAHWGIENHLHWTLDVVFHDDLARLRTGYGPQNMAAIKHAALNVLGQTKKTMSLKNRRKRAGWNMDYLADIILGVA